MPGCPRCGQENSGQARFCQNCGMSLAPTAQAREERKDGTPAAWWAMTDDQLFISTDGGVTQHQIPLPQGYVQRNESFADANRGWVGASQSPPAPQAVQATPTGTSDILLETDDGGATWHQAKLP